MCGFSYRSCFLQLEKCFLFGEVWQQLTEHSRWVSTVYILILNVSISASINTLLGTNIHLDLWSHLWFWLNSSICSKGSNKFTALSVREDSQTVALSWFTACLFLPASEHTNTFCNRFGISKSFQKRSNVFWSFLNNYLFFQGQLSNTVKSDIQETCLDE